MFFSGYILGSGIAGSERLHFHFSLSCIGEGNGNPLQCSCLENPRDGGAWWAAVYGVKQNRTRLKWLSSSMVALVLVFKGTSILFSIVPLPIYIHTYIYIYTHCIYCIYVCVYRYMYIYTLSSTAYLCILEIKVLLVTSFASIFSHSLGCHFVLFMVSFAVQNLVSLIKSHLSSFGFTSTASEEWSKKTLVPFMSENLFPVFCCSFIGAFTFWFPGTIGRLDMCLVCSGVYLCVEGPVALGSLGYLLGVLVWEI